MHLTGVVCTLLCCSRRNICCSPIWIHLRRRPALGSRLRKHISGRQLKVNRLRKISEWQCKNTRVNLRKLKFLSRKRRPLSNVCHFVINASRYTVLLLHLVLQPTFVCSNNVDRMVVPLIGNHNHFLLTIKTSTRLPTASKSGMDKTQRNRNKLCGNSMWMQTNNRQIVFFTIFIPIFSIIFALSEFLNDFRSRS